MYRMILLFKDHTLGIDANISITMDESILTNYMNSNTFTKHFKTLFSTNHLQLIKSTCFSPQGLQLSPIEKYPINKAFTDIIPRQEGAKPELDAFTMKMASSQFMTNFSNM